MQQGWIKLYRQIQDSFLWQDKPFNRKDAWIDLLLSANHEDKPLLFNGQITTIQRGQLLTSVRKLADRWGWSKDRTSKFLALLESEQMIDRDSDSKRTLLTIVNYDIYQSDKDSDKDSNWDTDKDTDKDTVRTLTRTQGGHRLATNKNVKNEKNEKNEKKYIYNHPTDGMSEGFSDLVQSVVDEYNTICVSFPKVTKISDARKKAIKARLNNYTRDDFTTLFEKAEASAFLKGGNNRNWSTDFDWLIKDANMAKVLDGNYDSNKSSASGKQTSGSAYIDAINSRFDVINDWLADKEDGL